MSSSRVMVFALLIIAILTFVSAVTYPRLVPSANAIARTFSLVGILAAWNNTTPNPNPTITVTQGDSVTISLSSGDALPHRFFVDVDKTGEIPNCTTDKCSAFFPPSTTHAFTVDFSPSTYVYYCSVHPTTMVGTFVVQAPPRVGGALVPPDKLTLLAPFIALSVVLVVMTAIIYSRQGMSKQKE